MNHFLKVNSFLRTIDKNKVPGLTAKVFRTFIATQIVKESLARPPIEVNKESSEMEKIYVAKKANLVWLLPATIRRELIQITLLASKPLRDFKIGGKEKGGYTKN